MGTNSTYQKNAVYKSICDIRTENQLGCKNCTLNGYKECMKSDGTGPTIVGSGITKSKTNYPVSRNASYQKRYTCHWKF